MDNPKIRIHLSENDLQHLMNGDTYDWTFPSDTGQDIDIHLYQGDNPDE